MQATGISSKAIRAAILLVEVRGDSEEALRANLETLQCESSYARAELFGDESDKVWKLRAAGLGLLSNVPGDAKPVACIEDTAVRIDVLQEYIREFDALMQGFGQESVYYAHAGAGELHLRPILNLKTSEGVRLLYEISKASAELVKKYGGSLSGEHGDGRVRAAFITRLLWPRGLPLDGKLQEGMGPREPVEPGQDCGRQTHERRFALRGSSRGARFRYPVSLQRRGRILTCRREMQRIGRLPTIAFHRCLNVPFIHGLTGRMGQYSRTGECAPQRTDRAKYRRV